MVAFSQVCTSCAIYTVPAQMFNAQEQGNMPWLAHAHIMWHRCQCPALEGPRQVVDGGVYMWCPGQLSWQSWVQSGGCCCSGDGGVRRWELHLLALPPAVLLALPPGLCEPSRSSASSSHLSQPMTRAASAGSLLAHISFCLCC